MTSNYLTYTAMAGAISLAACADAGEPPTVLDQKFESVGEQGQGQRFTRYIALGDSFVSGDGNWDHAWGDACKRSNKSWPHVLASALGEGGTRPTLDLAACSGATIDTVRSEQLPKVESADANTLITVTVGGNDLGIGKELLNCFNPKTSCTDRESDLTARIDAAGLKLEELFGDIKSRAMGATVVATGDPLLVTANAHLQPVCKGLLDMGEVAMIRRLIQAMNAKIALAADNATILAIPPDELERAFATHEACAPDANHNRWINGGYYVADLGPWVLHPNVDGNRAFARTVKAGLDRLGVATVSRVTDIPGQPFNPGHPQDPRNPLDPASNPPSTDPATGNPLGNGGPYGGGSGDPGPNGDVSGNPNGDSSGDPYGDGASYGDGSGEPYGDGSGGSMGDGSGDSSGDGSGDPYGDGSGEPYSDGSGDPYGDDIGDGYGDGSGDPYSDGSGDPYGDGSGDGYGGD